MVRNSSKRSNRRGNTDTPVEKQCSGSRWWAFTHNFDKFGIDQKGIEECKLFLVPYIDKIERVCSDYYIGLEIGKESQRLHLQGWMRFNDKIRLTGVKRVFTNTTSWRQCKGSETDNILYVCKEPLHLWKKNREPKKKIVPVKIRKQDELFEFQKDLEKLCLGEINENKIIWIVDFGGQIGKTEWLRYMNITYGVPFAYGGKCADIINLAYNNKEYLETTERPCFIYNLGRDTDPEKISYSSMEQLSDGAIANTKFEGACFVFNKPHVIVLANCLPIMSKMTRSRWILKEIKDGRLIDYVEEHKLVKKIKKLIK